MDKPFKNRRRKLIVNKSVQKRIIINISFVPVIGLIGATLGVAILANQVMEQAQDVREELPAMGPLFLTLFLFILSAGGVVIIQALKYSNRVAGPMYRLMRSIDRITDGDLSFRIKLRQGDELEELSVGFNKLLDWLEEHPPTNVDLRRSSSEWVDTDDDKEELSKEAGEEQVEATVGSGAKQGD